MRASEKWCVTKQQTGLFVFAHENVTLWGSMLLQRSNHGMLLMCGVAGNLFYLRGFCLFPQDKQACLVTDTR